MQQPKFGATTDPMKDIVREISLVAKHKFDFVEISIEPQIFFSDEIGLQKSRINKILRESRMFATVHAPWNAELGNSYSEVNEGWLEMCKELIDAVKQIDAVKLNVHLYSQQNLRNEKLRALVIKNNIENLKILVAYGKKKDMEIVLETMAGDDQIYEIHDIKKILDLVKGLGLTFDSGHCFVNGGMEYIKRFLSVFQSRITHMHFHDNHGDTDEHLPLGRGAIDFNFIVKFLRSSEYSQTITFETFHGGDSKTNAVHARKYISKLLEKS